MKHRGHADAPGLEPTFKRDSRFAAELMSEEVAHVLSLPLRSGGPRIEAGADDTEFADAWGRHDRRAEV